MLWTPSVAPLLCRYCLVTISPLYRFLNLTTRNIQYKFAGAMVRVERRGVLRRCVLVALERFSFVSLNFPGGIRTKRKPVFLFVGRRNGSVSFYTFERSKVFSPLPGRHKYQNSKNILRTDVIEQLKECEQVVRDRARLSEKAIVCHVMAYT